jgi:protein-S-isoprenylcysteine O-methyltransferase Ste14
MPTWKVILFLAATIGLLVVSRQSRSRPQLQGFYRFLAWELLVLLLLLTVDRWFLNRREGEWKSIVFIAATIVLLVVSWKSLSRSLSHGFYRFLAWEIMVLLFLLNVHLWFFNPLAWYQLISWFLLVVCIFPLALGVRALSKNGQPDKNARQEPELFAFERTTQLVTDGIYKYIRHPLYSSLLLLNWGIFFKSPSWPGLQLALAASFLLVATAQADEAECIDVFGVDYQQYMLRTRMFIPYVL